MKRLPRALPCEVGIEPQAISRFVDRLNQNGCHSVMVLRHNKVAAEGWWAPHSEEESHVLYSLSKSFTSTAVGFAIQEGLLTEEDRVLDFFPDLLPSGPCANMEKLKIRHLLCMGTGHEEEPAIRDTKEWRKEFLASYIPREPGSLFHYNSMATYMLSAVVQKVTGQRVLDYLKPRLFAPLGIDAPDLHWEQSPEGIDCGGWGLFLRTEDIAKMGTFLLNKGKWEGEQLLNPQWIEKAGSTQIDNSFNVGWLDWHQGYGYQFWMCSEEGVFRGDGASGQYCIVMPKQDMVIAMTAGLAGMNVNLEAVWDCLLPGVKDEVEADEDAQKELEAKLMGLQIPLAVGEADGPAVALCHGKSYSVGENALGIDRISFSMEDGCVITIARGPQVFSVKADNGAWRMNYLDIPDWCSRGGTCFDKIGGACYAVNGNTLDVKLCFVRTTICMSLRFRFTENGFYAETDSLPNHDMHTLAGVVL